MFVAPFTNDIALRNSYDYDDVNWLHNAFVDTYHMKDFKNDNPDDSVSRSPNN
jgi:hypothetical protein